MKRYITVQLAAAFTTDGELIAVAYSTNPKIAKNAIKTALNLRVQVGEITGEPDAEPPVERTANALLVFDDEGAEMAPYLDTSTIPDEQLAAVDAFLLGRAASG